MLSTRMMLAGRHSGSVLRSIGHQLSPGSTAAIAPPPPSSAALSLGLQRSYALSRFPRHTGPRSARGAGRPGPSSSASGAQASHDRPFYYPSQDSRQDPPVNAALLTPVVVPYDPDGVLQRDDVSDDGGGVSRLLGNSALVVTRELEMMNVFMGFEQANRYAILAPNGAHVGYMAEEETGIFGGAFQRQVFRTHRPFRSFVMDATGRIVLIIRRPYKLINSRAFVYSTSSYPNSPYPPASLEKPMLIGEAQQVWHPWRRKFDLFLNRPPSSEPEKEHLDQFAYIDAPLLSWDFYLQDADGNPVGAINRNFRGFGRELFTDTGQYVIRFEAVAQEDMFAPSLTTPGVVGGKAVEERAVRPLTLDERAVTLATAVSIDFDYFSRHSGSGGFFPFFWMGGGGQEYREDGDRQGQEQQQSPSSSEPPSSAPGSVQVPSGDAGQYGGASPWSGGEFGPGMVGGAAGIAGGLFGGGRDALQGQEPDPRASADAAPPFPSADPSSPQTTPRPPQYGSGGQDEVWDERGEDPWGPDAGRIGGEWEDSAFRRWGDVGRRDMWDDGDEGGEDGLGDEGGNSW